MLRVLDDERDRIETMGLAQAADDYLEQDRQRMRFENSQLTSGGSLEQVDITACLGVQPEDEFVDLFPGSGAVTQEYERWRNQQRLIT